MLGTSDEVIENNIIFRKKVSSNPIDKARSIGETGSAMTGYPWVNRLRGNRLPEG